MLRQALESAYTRTLGELKGTVARSMSSLMEGGGLVRVLYVVIIVVYMSGFSLAVLYPAPVQSLTPYPSPSFETIPDAFVNAFVIALGGAGIYLVYLSGRQTATPRMVNFYLSAGLLLLIVSLFIGIDMAVLKGFG
ncbi:MAG: hypothetical protein JRN34_03670 [Nitrososphaerota archaeon]|jgi:hypothetical protein|nr:hypothetical protein [Nitrososphaerota archaeon]MDG6942004.1 hypothetical protein [Nitrososphaerota archaeon]MDG6942469.1 hypothetical protein [Nitrososphaerota archaeon]MDG6948256.1 hypothetical protein [Nitrososphaerota archaeon]